MDILEQQRNVLNKLRAWHQWDVAGDNSILASFRKKFFSKRPLCPSEGEVESLAKYYFPPRGSVKASICDFGHAEVPHLFQRQDVDIIEILDYGTLRNPGSHSNCGLNHFKSR